MSFTTRNHDRGEFKTKRRVYTAMGFKELNFNNNVQGFHHF